MVWLVLIGICMLFVHIVAREDPKREQVTIVALIVAWIVLVNIIAFFLFTMDKCFALTKVPQISEALVCYLFVLGGVVGGWLALIITCYKAPNKCSRFICWAMLSTSVGIAINVFLIVRVILPQKEFMFKHFNDIIGHN